MDISMDMEAKFKEYLSDTPTNPAPDFKVGEIAELYTYTFTLSPSRGTLERNIETHHVRIIKDNGDKTYVIKHQESPFATENDCPGTYLFR